MRLQLQVWRCENCKGIEITNLGAERPQHNALCGRKPGWHDLLARPPIKLVKVGTLTCDPQA